MNSPGPKSSREKVWVVRAGDGATIGEIVHRAREGVRAIGEGRVFIGKKRAVRADQPVRPGDVVRIGPDVIGAGARTSSTSRAPLGSVAPGFGSQAPKVRASTEIDILFQAHGLVAVSKPAGLPTVPDHAGSSHSLVALVAKAIGEKTETLRITSRLDREVSGVVVFALDAVSEARLRQARAEGKYQRRYVAIASVQNAHIGMGGLWDAPIGRSKNPRLREIPGADPKPASTRWRIIARSTLAAESDASASADRDASVYALLAVDPMTGRTHQIRLHASHAGAPLVGDRDYRGPMRIALANGSIVAPSRIALHAARVIVPSKNAEPIEARSPVPGELTTLWTQLGGDAKSWDEAIGVGLHAR